MCLREHFRLFTEQLTAECGGCGGARGQKGSKIKPDSFTNIHSAGRRRPRPRHRAAPFKRALIRDRHGKRLTFSNTGNLVSVGTYGFKIADYQLSNATRFMFHFKGSHSLSVWIMHKQREN